MEVEVTTKLTGELVPGDVVRLPLGHVRTVVSIDPTPYLNCENKPLVIVRYDPREISQWSDGNLSSPDEGWELL